MLRKSKIFHSLLASGLAISLTGCASGGFIVPTIENTAFLDVGALVVGSWVGVQLNAKPSWQGSVLKRSDVLYEVRLTQSAFQSGYQPASSSARELARNLCPQGWQWARYEEGISSQFIGSAPYAYGVLHCTEPQVLADKTLKEPPVLPVPPAVIEQKAIQIITSPVPPNHGLPTLPLSAPSNNVLSNGLPPLAPMR